MENVLKVECASYQEVVAVASPASSTSIFTLPSVHVQTSAVLQGRVQIGSGVGSGGAGFLRVVSVQCSSFADSLQLFLLALFLIRSTTSF